MNPDKNIRHENKNRDSSNACHSNEKQQALDDFLDAVNNNLNVYQCAANITLDDASIEEIIDTLKIVYKAKLLILQSKNILCDNHLNPQFVNYLLDEIDKNIEKNLISETKDFQIKDDTVCETNDSEEKCSDAAEYVKCEIECVRSENDKLLAVQHVLRSAFKHGFRMHSSLEFQRFDHCFEQIYHEPLPLTEDALLSMIQGCCLIYGEMAYLPEELIDEPLKQKLLEDIEQKMRSGQRVFYQVIYDQYSNALISSKIQNVDMLKSYLSYVFKDQYHMAQSYMSCVLDDSNPALDDIRECVLSHGKTISFDQLYASLPNLPKQVIEEALHTSHEFILFTHACVHESQLYFPDDFLKEIDNQIQQTLEDKGFMTGDDLYNVIKENYPDVIDNNIGFPVYGFRDILKTKYKFDEKYAFQGNIISPLGKNLSSKDILKNYALSHDTFTVSDILNLTSNSKSDGKYSLARGYIDTLYESHLRISQEGFASKKYAQFDIDAIDDLLDRICVNEYIPLQSIADFSLFPYAGFPWNTFLLEHYVAEYSKKFKLIHIKFRLTVSVGAIVRNTSKIKNINELMIDVLAHAPIKLDKMTALQYLSEQKYIANKQFAKIETLIYEANALRQRDK